MNQRKETNAPPVKRNRHITRSALTGLVLLLLFSTTIFATGIAPRQPMATPDTLVKPAHPSQLTVKFADHLSVRAADGGLRSAEPAALSSVGTVATRYGLTFEQLIKLPRTTLDRIEKRAALRSGTAQPDLAGMIVVHGPEGQLEAAARELNALDSVEWVSFSMQRPEPPCSDIVPTTSDYFGAGFQSYHGPNPGLNMTHAWTLGARGQGIQIADCEYGYIIGTEDLCNVIDEPGQTVDPTVASYGWDNHGTAVLGEMVSLDNAYGCTGLVPDATALFFSEWTVEEGSRRVTAIANAIASVECGDVVLLEMQTVNFGSNYGPAELDPAVWTVVRNGTDAGVIVVGAAGNGDQDLDSATYATYRGWGDSGAIIVGAGSADTSHDKLSFSTYGSRVNVQAWGDWSVFTLGYGDYATYGGDDRQQYTAGFSGTSSASPMVTACVASLQSLSEATYGCRMGPRSMRQLLMDNGIAQGSGGHIGPLPDMAAASSALLGLGGCEYGGYNDACGYFATDTVSAEMQCLPSSGTVPFTVTMWVTLDNLYASQTRRVAAAIDVTLASGGYFSNWRAGYTNIAGGESYNATWNQNIPAFGAVLGNNLFDLTAEDVTPAPYNQPPYPAAGDTDTSACVVTAQSP